MMMFLTILLMSVVITTVCVALMSAATAAENEKPSISPAIEVDPPRFFDVGVLAGAAPRELPAELLLSHIERHVRLEQAAAERFVSLPTLESLHAPTESTFVN